MCFTNLGISQSSWQWRLTIAPSVTSYFHLPKGVLHVQPLPIQLLHFILFVQRYFEKENSITC
jgi:hypothetical protein